MLDRDQYLKLLTEMISHSKHLQNDGKTLIPKEDLIVEIVERELKSYSTDVSISNPLEIKRVTYDQGRSNLIIKYQNFGSNIDDGKTLTFCGSHMDVVPANPSLWKYDPFSLTEVDDKFYGRGTTDCLGHVALLTIYLKYLATHNIVLPYTLYVIFIANEECGNEHVGIEHMARDGYLSQCRNGPFYWMDCSDIHPVLASGTAMAWELMVTGKRAHGGFPFNGINPIPIAFELSREVTKYFNTLCPYSTVDKEYGFKCGSNIKPTIITLPEGGSTNQIPDWIKIKFDVRMTPFSDSKEIFEKVKQFVDNFDLKSLEKWHDAFNTELADISATKKIELAFGPYVGAKCEKGSQGYQLLENATLKHHGSCNPTSELGALPLVSDLISIGLDVHMMGYGITEVYHGNDEYCTFSMMSLGYQIIDDIVKNR